MKRIAEDHLRAWITRSNRKPLVIRGARQVGKSTLVRQFAKNAGFELLEVNLEREPKLLSSFQTLSPQKIIRDLEAVAQKSVVKGKTLLFLDEIQAIPEALAALRYFYEEQPDLPILAAGSLLEFILSQHQFSMPVGRIEHFHLGPMTFKEFILALSENKLLEALEAFTPADPPSELAHSKLTELLQEYFFVGGMPEAISLFAKTRNFKEVRRIQRDLIETYRNDFAKYRNRVPLARLDRVFEFAATSVGEKVKYRQISDSEQSRELKAAIELLEKAKILYRVHHTHASGLPLKSGADEAIYKFIFLDVGLANQMMGLEWSAYRNIERSKILPLGKIAEQFAGQHLLYYEKGLAPPALHYWLREGKANNAEVDYLLQANAHVFPIEIKAGRSGAIKSLVQFAIERKVSRVVKFDLAPPTYRAHSQKVSSRKEAVHFKLLSLPLYAIEELERILRVVSLHEKDSG